jgi:hypothetical protein
MSVHSGNLLRWLLYRLFAVLATLYLLVPPGYCLCDGFAELLVPIPENQPEDDHAPGCPARKTPYLQQFENPGPDLDATFLGDMVAEPLPPLAGFCQAWETDPTLGAWASEPPLYLALRALRI